MPPVANVNDLSWIRRFIRFFSAAIPRRSVHDTTQKIKKPVSTSPKPRRKPPIKRPSGSVPQDVERKTLDVFEKIHLDIQKLADLQTRIDETQKDVDECHLQYHNLERQVDCAKDDQRIGVGISYIQDEMAEIQDHIAAERPKIDTLRTEAAVLRRSIMKHWGKVRDLSKHYFNACLKVNFRSPWCMREHECRWLQHCFQEQQTISHANDAIAELYKELTSTRKEHRRAPGGSKEDLTEARLNRLTQEESQLRSKLSDQQHLKKLAENHLEKNLGDIHKRVLVPVLRDVGKIASEDDQPPEPPINADMPFDYDDIVDNADHNPDVLQDPDDPLEEEDPSITVDPIPYEPSRADDNSIPENDPQDIQNGDFVSPVGSTASDVSVEELQRRFTYCRDILEELQKERDRETNELIHYEVDHLVTFTNATHQTYQTFMTELLDEKSRQIGLREEELMELRRRLVESGAEIPRSSPSNMSLHSVKGSRISKSSSRSGGKLSPTPSPRTITRDIARTRRKANEWRLEEAVARAGASSPRRSSPRSGRGTVGRRSPSLSPGEIRRRERWWWRRPAHQAKPRRQREGAPTPEGESA